MEMKENWRWRGKQMGGENYVVDEWKRILEMEIE